MNEDEFEGTEPAMMISCFFASSIVCTFDGEVVPFEIEGIRSGNVTRGHRFMGSQHIEVRRFEDYAQKLNKEFVIVDASARIETIRTEARNLSFAQGLELVEPEPAVEDVRGEVADVAHLLTAQADAPQRLVVQAGDGRDVRDAAVREERLEPSEDRGGGLGRQLLEIGRAHV